MSEDGPKTDAIDDELWETDPEKAARLAFLRLQCLWHEQVQQGVYRGIPAFEQPRERATRSSRQVEPDRDVGVYDVPAELLRRFAA